MVQLYLAAPAGQLGKPASELKAFGKTNLLQPNGSQILTFTIAASDLASFDPVASAWAADAGTYTVNIGSSSLDIKASSIFNLPKSQTLGQVSRILIPQKPIPAWR